MAEEPILLTDDPAPHVRRLTLNRPAKRNALSNALRGEIFAALEAADRDPEVRVIVLRGAGTCFSSGYDLSSLGELPYYTAGGQGQWARHVVEGCFRVWDLAKPVIAQVHGWCLAGGSELAVACDLVYVAEDAQIGYPAVRTMSPPDNQYHAWIVGMRAAMELMLTGDAFDGLEAVRLGFANRAFKLEELEAQVLAMASRIAKVDPELAQLNKRLVHRQMEAMGMRAGLRAGTDLHALGWHTPASRAYMAELRQGVTQALQSRDAVFNDYRAGDKPEPG
ncbi:enoyl-CoA hydratase-related protein [Phenylobacterium aquaticum]|uniref:enoyl-CoA hydratase-related protein n=1 Tax=Phenylobacterium aquaticum TaxID=1763816 RepID=UPI0026EF4B6D|nr:enoyl-CoA hydratase-related protein [Phenylobacterium aquaticum]